MEKTNAMRLLDKSRIPYSSYSYDASDGKIDGISVAAKLEKPLEQVYKTLVLKGVSRNIYVFILPVADEVDLKKAAKASGEKSIEMISVKDILAITGYVRGGCSPFGMKKHYPTFIDQSAALQPTIIVSAGKIGLQVELKTEDLLRETKAILADIRR